MDATTTMTPTTTPTMAATLTPATAAAANAPATSRPGTSIARSTQPLRTKARAATPAQEISGGARIALGVVLGILGVALTSGSRSGSGVTVYYGLVWVGVESILKGLWVASTDRPSAEMDKGTRFGFGFVGLLVALGFLAASLHG